MIAAAIERGDRRSEPEVVAALLVGAELTAERHHDPAMRLRGRRRGPVHDRLLALVGHDEAVWLFLASERPVDGQGRPRADRRCPRPAEACTGACLNATVRGQVRSARCRTWLLPRKWAAARSAAGSSARGVKLRKDIAAACAAACMLGAAAAPATAQTTTPPPITSDNVSWVKNIAYEKQNGTTVPGGTDIEFTKMGGREYALAGSYR